MRVPVLCLLLSLAACSSEPDFDERYEQAEQKIRDKAAELDAELAEKGGGELESSDEKHKPEAKSGI